MNITQGVSAKGIKESYYINILKAAGEPSPDVHSESGEAQFDRNDGKNYVREKQLAAIWVREGQPKFRKDLLRAYKGCCAVTGCDAESALEATHIESYADGGEQHVRNGLLLRADIHTLFDKHLISVDDEFCIVLSGALRKSSYASLHKMNLRMPEGADNQPSEEALLRHYRAFLKEALE